MEFATTDLQHTNRYLYKYITVNNCKDFSSCVCHWSCIISFNQSALLNYNNALIGLDIAP